MRLQQHIIVQYTIVTLVVISILSTVLGWVITRNITDHLIQTHIRVFPEIVADHVEDHPAVLDFLESPPGTEVPEGARSFFRHLMKFGMVFRIKVWGADGTILWSDQPSLVGGRFPENRHFQAAMQGGASYGLGAPLKREHAGESGVGHILEIYTPVFRDGRVSGVLELYESDRALFRTIKENTNVVWISVSIGGGVLYVLLFGIFLNAYRRQQRISDELIRTQEATIFSLAYQAKLRDIETGLHLERAARYMDILAEELSKEPAFADMLTPTFRGELVKSAPLHDIGKVGVPDAILNKPHQLTVEEFAIMKKHCQLGAEILGKAGERLPLRHFLHVARDVVLYHHERWDGAGYPEGLKGEEIPLGARLMSVIDVYDALRSERYYKTGSPHDECLAVIREEAGKRFDPRVVEGFLRSEERFRDVSVQLADPAGTGSV